MGIGINPRDSQAAREQVTWAIRLAGLDRSSAAAAADWLLQPQRGVAPAALLAALNQLLGEALRRVVAVGWEPRDLGEITRRRLGEAPVALVDRLLRAEELGRPDRAGLRDRKQLERALAVAAMLAELPPLPRLDPSSGGHPVDRGQGDPAQARMLTKVRALLAKAESTDFPDEAEVFTAKAQQLISRHSLHDLMDAATSAGGPNERALVARRLWIEGSYVLPKAMLVAAVARANRSKAVVSESLGLVTIIGTAGDLDAVELLSTSLLAQAAAAMVRVGRQSGVGGAARSSSFRRAFLTSYADRIGERLEEADRVATAAGDAALVPVLRRHAERVEATVEALFPLLRQRTTTVRNPFGWAQGRAAADRATLDTRRQVS